MAKQLTAFRLSDRTKDNIQTALELLRKDLAADNMEWMADRQTRTDVIEKAIDYYLSEMLHREQARDQARRDQAAKKKKQNAPARTVGRRAS